MFDPAGNMIVSHDDRDSFVTAARTGLEGAQSIHQMHNDEIDQISALNRDERIGPDPDTFNYVP